VQAFACDLDGTLIASDGIVGDRTRAAIARSQGAGIPVLVATGRMFRSVRRYLDDVGLPEPVVCYQGAAVVDPRSGEFLLHKPLDLGAARDAIAELGSLGISPNVYVDDQLYVAEENDYTRRYSVFQRLPVVEVGDLLAWLDRPPTKLVAVAEPPVLAEIRPRLAARLDGRAFLTTSLPYMLEIGNPGVTKGSGIAFVARLLGLELDRMIAFGDGENDVELLEAVGFGVAVEGGHARLQAIADATCPGPADEGVASVIEAVLDSTT
jgi:Cof subfamily protein (haloacid dehalogenase superfamily)